jgi:hypothetical protein
LTIDHCFCSHANRPYRMQAKAATPISGIGDLVSMGRTPQLKPISGTGKVGAIQADGGRNRASPGQQASPPDFAGIVSPTAEVM